MDEPDTPNYKTAKEHAAALVVALRNVAKVAISKDGQAITLVVRNPRYKDEQLAADSAEGDKT